MDGVGDAWCCLFAVAGDVECFDVVVVEPFDDGVDGCERYGYGPFDVEVWFFVLFDGV